jgi:hypothetical protein
MKKSHYIIGGVLLVSLLGYFAYKKFGNKGDKGKGKAAETPSASNQGVEVKSETQTPKPDKSDNRTSSIRFKDKAAEDAYLKLLEKSKGSASLLDLDSIRKMSS